MEADSDNKSGLETQPKADAQGRKTRRGLRRRRSGSRGVAGRENERDKSTPHKEAKSPAQPNTLADLQAEIAMLHTLTRRVVELSGDIDGLDSAIDVLQALSMASTRLRRLLVLQKSVAPATPGLDEAIAEVLEELRREHGAESEEQV